MTTLAELRLANLREQKKSAEPAGPESAPAAPPETAPPPAAAVYAAPAAREDDLVLSQYLTDAGASPVPAEDTPDPETARALALVARVHAALAAKSQHPNGAKATVDMSPALFHRAKRYCLDHGNVTLRQLFLDLMTEFLNEEGY